MPSSVSSKDPGNSTAYINGHVYTINPQHPWASAFIISPNGIFTAVGTDEAILKQAHSTRLVTVGLKGQFVMPGIHDAHMHLLYSGLALTSDATLPMDHTHENIAQHIKDGSCACHYINTYQDWIMANMYFNGGFPDGVADRKYLDDLFPDTPVVVLGGGAHSRLLNTAALKRAGYDIENEPDVQGAKFFRRPDGSLTGEIAEHAMNKVALSIPFPGLAHIKRVLKYAIRMAHKAGVTSCQEASSNTLIMNALKELEEEGSLDMDIATHIVYAPETVAHERQESLLKLLDQADAYKSRHVNTRFVKIIMDGVPLPPLYTHCELDQDGKPNMDKILVQDFADAIAKYDERGMTVKIHCAGRGSTRLSLDAIEMAREKNPNGPRHEIAHSSSVHDVFFVHPVTSSNPDTMDWNFPKLMAANAHITIGSDWGASPDPSLLPPAAAIVKSVGGGSKEKGGEMLCKMLTVNGAEAVGKEKEVGKIEVGMKANFIVVDKDLSKGEFEGANIVRTYFEGECVWDRDF